STAEIYTLSLHDALPISRRKKEWGRVEAARPNQIWQSDMTKIWAGPTVGWAYLVSVIDCCTREIVGWNLSHRCRTEEALAAVERSEEHTSELQSRFDLVC